MSVNTKVNGQLVKSAGLYSVTKPIGMADIYSTEEKEVGLWIDNKPLYQKCIIIVPTASSTSVDISSLNIDKLVSRKGTVRRESGTTIQQKDIEYRTEPSSYNAYGFTCELLGTNLIFNIEGYTYSEIKEARITIQYTKIADTPWSGKFVPQGYGYVSSGDIYSLEERQVGVWTDGKPLYQKTFEFNGTYTGTNNNLSVSLPSAETAFITNCWGINASGVSLNFPYAYPDNNTNNNTIFISSDNTYLGLRVGSNQTISKLVATIQYTKTTDVAGSGEYVPSGDKAEHYSANEEVIGTFLGETLYRKVIPITANWDFTANTWVKSNIPQGDIKALINGRIEIFYNNTYSLHFIQLGVVDNMIAGNSFRQFSAVANGANLILEYTKTS